MGMIKMIFAGLVMLVCVGCAPAPSGCCKTANGCASGVGVDEALCAGELSGTWNADTDCNTVTGMCCNASATQTCM
jgi:hypothetical protein